MSSIRIYFKKVDHLLLMCVDSILEGFVYHCLNEVYAILLAAGAPAWKSTFG
jgi:hypothetical protein